MNKLFKGLLIVVGVVSALVFGVDETQGKTPIRTKVDVTIESNVGDGQEYAYQITDINEVEVHGVPLNKESYTNKGIFLYLDELPFEVKLGDKIVVVWGEYEDEFELIDRAIQLENGDYISETKLKSFNNEVQFNRFSIEKGVDTKKAVTIKIKGGLLLWKN